jgi:hypothetical protein
MEANGEQLTATANGEEEQRTANGEGLLSLRVRVLLSIFSLSLLLSIFYFSVFYFSFFNYYRKRRRFGAK